jgi:hypothetical protein
MQRADCAKYCVQNIVENGMSEPDFYPAPHHPPRSFLRWLLLLVHGGLFALLIYFHPLLVEADVSFLTGFTGQMIIAIWGGLLVLQLVMVTLWDTIEGIVYARRERKRREEYRSQKNRRRLLNQFVQPTESTDAAES